MRSVGEFDAFDADCDPYGEHDFGALTIQGGEDLFQTGLFRSIDDRRFAGSVRSLRHQARLDRNVSGRVLTSSPPRILLGGFFFVSEDNGLEPLPLDQTLPFKCCQNRLGQSGLVILWQIRRPMHGQFQFFIHGSILPHRPAAAN